MRPRLVSRENTAVDASGQHKVTSRGTARTVDAPFTVSFQAGQIDKNGQFMGGTELMNMVAYKGRLYAGNGYGLDIPGSDPRPGPQLLVLDSAGGQWQQQQAFSEKLPNGSLRFNRLTALKAVTFTTDGQGRRLPEPVSRLLVGLTGSSEGNGAVFSWDDETNTWTKMDVGKQTVRALAFYQDPVTGVDRVFAGSDTPKANGAIFSGVYDVSAPGQIRWNAQPEFTDFTHRVMAFVECNGRLYFAAKPSVYQRDNGPTPKWTTVYSYPENSIPVVSSGLRGLTCIPNPDGPGEVILTAMEGVGQVLRINPTTGQAITEFRIERMLRKLWNGSGFYMVAAYNDMPLLRDPTSNELLYLIGLGVCPTLHQCTLQGMENSAWYLTRDSQAHYSLFEVKPLSQKPLVAVRTIIESPFSEEAGKTLYLGGYDSDHKRSHNAAWIYRVGLHTALERGSQLASGHD
jgi:hypothetical protein